MTNDYPEERIGAVAVLDALGMRDANRADNYRDLMVLLRGHLAQLKRSTAFDENFSGSLRQAGADLPPLQNDLVGFQDTFVACCWPENPNTDPRRSLAYLSTLLGRFLADAMDEPLYPFFFRGAVEVGRFTIWDGLVFGEAYIEAYDCQEAAQWIGIHAGRRAAALLNESRDDPAQSRFFVPYAIPLKNRPPLEGFALPWPDLEKGRMQIVREVLEQQIQKHEREDIKAKYENTMSFADWRWANSGGDPQEEGTI